MGHSSQLSKCWVNVYSSLETLFGELKEIFHTSPFVHLGGDGMKLSRPCLLEAGRNAVDTDQFERYL